MSIQSFILLTISVALIFSCTSSEQLNYGDGIPIEKDDFRALTDSALLNEVQYQTFNYFWEGAEPTSGMARERLHTDDVYPENDKNIVTLGGTGFGVMAILVGIERGFISREEGFERLQQIVNFLDTADRFHGVWPHWLNGETGKVKPFSPKDDGGDLVETAFMIQGLLTVRQYFREGNEAEQQLAAKIDELWKAVEWDWYTQGKDVLYWHWSPNHAWEMNFPVGGYNECLIMYVLAAASPTHSIEPDVYHLGWARNGAIETEREYLDYNLVLDHFEHNDAPVGPLFWAHYSYLGLDPRNLEDRYGNYWELNQNHALVNYKYALENPEDYEGYGENCWGLTSSYSINGYAGHRPGEDLGVISPTAALSSFPYTPDESMQMLRFLYQEADSLVGDFGPYDAFSFEHDWYLPRYLAIDQGPIPVMIENHRTAMLWNLFMSAPEVKQGLDKLGFKH
ncbi:glucoamylase family protein [Catalinimonas niigatensis]|uniref:glucoamylase family protein n=1 Tax=Catalinimonas niigatensis TaxID=1397264 RepID=UPI0026658865|nr:glucoamylase family protein [Catalinimonas niigatensis]WPP51107.1 glucoamylase family protein [Catalinimonas niigatensis]